MKKHAVQRRKVEFIEAPLDHIEARRGLIQFEKQYDVSSADVFAGNYENCSKIDSDDLYEWRTYYEFLKEYDSRMVSLLATMGNVSNVMYRSESEPSRHKGLSQQSRKRANLCIAA